LECEIPNATAPLLKVLVEPVAPELVDVPVVLVPPVEAPELDETVDPNPLVLGARVEAVPGAVVVLEPEEVVEEGAGATEKSPVDVNTSEIFPIFTNSKEYPSPGGITPNSNVRLIRPVWTLLATAKELWNTVFTNSIVKTCGSPATAVQLTVMTLDEAIFVGATIVRAETRGVARASRAPSLKNMSKYRYFLMRMDMEIFYDLFVLTQRRGS